jgi:hypothetical protein
MNIKHLILATFFIGLSLTAAAQQLTVGSFNLRYDNAGDEGNRWEKRGPVAANLIRFHQFDVLLTTIISCLIKHPFDRLITGISVRKYRRD